MLRQFIDRGFECVLDDGETFDCTDDMGESFTSSEEFLNLPPGVHTFYSKSLCSSIVKK